MKNTVRLSALAGLAAAGVAHAQPVLRFNEVLVNPPGTDQGLEFIELKSATPNFDMSGLFIITIDGDNTNRGDVDQVLSLEGLSTGANGLFLWRDGALALFPEPEAATSIFIQDFVPDLENGACTWLIVRGFTGRVGDDLDTNNDGILDVFPWAEVIDAVSYIEGEDILVDSSYAPQLGGIDISGADPDPNVAYTADSFAVVGCNTYSMDIFGSAPGPWVNDAAQTLGFPENLPLPDPYFVTPGARNMGDEGCEQGCPADYNGDGFLDFFDLDAFVACFEGDGCPDGRDADYNGDGFVDFFDLDAYVADFEAGC
ncbi:MAG: hypothetical protein HRU70_14300 [Phycisphaeraceae bacterium]|nr:MAG: hypothetical protein HRU70_14300 [Phycisphaeraceae bacterium]